MNPFHSPFDSLRKGAGAFLLIALAACGGGIDPILGTPGVARVPTVTATSPLGSTPAVTGVDTRTLVTATFSKPMLASSINATSFTLACPAAAPVAATVAYNAATQVATLTPTSALPPSTTCVATVSTAAQDSTGIALGSAFAWSFVTGVATPLDTCALIS
ncbi:MAG: Ig-like domain-containing protein [Hylemonella sp.]